MARRRWTRSGSSRPRRFPPRWARPGRAGTLLLMVTCSWSCGDRQEAPASEGDGVAVSVAWSRVDAFGDPRPGLSQEQRSRFQDGRTLFDRVFDPEEGVGPLFNEDQCSACHTDPASGGTGEQLVRKAARFDEDLGTCDLLAHRGGENLRSRVAPAASRLGVVRDTIPAGATHVGSFDVPFLFGLGAAEAVPDSVFLRLSDPDDRDGDGISGRVGRTADGRIGRFGRKADVATLRDFTLSALLNEMGLTAEGGPPERGTNGAALPPGADPAPDPEVSVESVDLITDFVRFLGVPPAALPRDSTLWLRGRELFRRGGMQRMPSPGTSGGLERGGSPLL